MGILSIKSVAIIEKPRSLKTRSPTVPLVKAAILAELKGETPFASIAPVSPASTSPVPPTVILGLPVLFNFTCSPSEIISKFSFSSIVNPVFFAKTLTWLALSSMSDFITSPLNILNSFAWGVKTPSWPLRASKSPATGFMASASITIGLEDSRINLRIAFAVSWWSPRPGPTITASTLVTHFFRISKSSSIKTSPLSLWTMKFGE